MIGIDDYDNGWPRLSNAILDAELIAEALEAKGFDVELHRNPDSEALPQIFKAKTRDPCCPKPVAVIPLSPTCASIAQ